jgi:hypothetical protein
MVLGTKAMQVVKDTQWDQFKSHLIPQANTMEMGKSTTKRNVCNNSPCVDAHEGDFDVSQVPLLMGG